MSVRRLAPDPVQPKAFAFGREKAAEAKKWIAKYPQGREASAVIPLLMLAQEQDGWVTRAAIEQVAGMLSMPFIRVLEVATFYTQFQLQPVGTKAHVQVCGTTPCMLRGSLDLIDVCKRKIHPEQFHTNKSGSLSWEEVECQGACVNAPMVMIFKDTYEDLTPKRLEEIIDAFEAGKGGTVKPGPQVDRIFSAPEGGLTSLIAVAAKKASAPKAAPATQKAAAPAKAPKPEPAAKISAEKTAKAVTAAKPALAKAPAEKAALLDDPNRPKGIKKPAKPDDLKMISGVGPKIEKILHELGIFTFAQVAAWKKAEREWVDGYLKFSGRIERDDWVKQAKALAKGGEAEYIRVFGKKPR
jgi:NADH-quinone oxidoreductase subunit E